MQSLYIIKVMDIMAMDNPVNYMTFFHNYPYRIFFCLILVCYLLSYSSALTLEAPRNAIVGENITIEVYTSSEDIMDMKILIINEYNLTISQVYSSGWKSSFYYIKSSFPERKTYLIRALEPAEKAALCVRARKAGTSAYEEQCLPISINGNLSSKESSMESETAIAKKTIFLENNINSGETDYLTRQGKALYIFSFLGMGIILFILILIFIKIL